MNKAVDKTKEQLLAELEELRKKCKEQEDKLKAKEHITAEEALLLSESRLQDAQRFAKIGSWSFNVVKQQPAWTDQMFRLFGIDPADGVPNYEEHKQFVHPDDWEMFDQAVQNTSQTGEGYDIEIRLVQPSGKVIWVNTRCQTKSQNGKIVELYGATQDITERKQGEEEIKRYSQIFEDSLNEIYLFDETLHFIQVNRASLKNLGYSMDELRTMTPLDIKPEFSPEYFNELIKPLYNREKEIIQFETVHQRKNKTKYNVEVHLQLMQIGNNRIFVAIIIDITERKQAEEDRERIFNQSFDMICTATMEGYLKELNPAWEKTLGWSHGELRSKPFIEFIHPDDRAITMEAAASLQEGNAALGFENRYQAKDGSYKWLSWNTIPILEKKMMMGIARDITKRKLDEEAILELKDFNESIVTNLAEGIILEGDDGIIQFANPAMVNMLGYEEGELVGKHWTCFVPDDQVEVVKNANKRRKKGKSDQYEMELIRKDGERIFVLVGGVPNINKGAYIGLLAAFTDISERKKAEQELNLAKEKAEESDRLKSAFLANMSHEIRTPMNGILGFTELLKEPELTGEAKEKYIKVIEKSGNRMLNTINDIIDISKIEAGQEEVVNKEVSVNRLLDEQFTFFQRETETKGLKLNYIPSLTDSESRIITDQRKLAGILTNLLKNAVKYTETGEITMGCHLKNKADRTFIEFFVRDTGIGIPSDRVEAIFNRFEQAETTELSPFEGSGLGLAISKSYVEMLGGEIGVSSKAGSGSTFTFSIPYNKISSEENSSKKNPKEEAGGSLKSLSVIVAEDDETSRMLFDEIFKNEFHKITYTKTGQETINVCRQNPETDLILMDIKMPVRSGYDATREIRKFNKDVKIIAQTAFAMMEDKEKALKAGCDDYITKPIKKAILFEKIRLFLDQ